MIRNHEVLFGLLLVTSLAAGQEKDNAASAPAPSLAAAALEQLQSGDVEKALLVIAIHHQRLESLRETL